MDPKELVKPTKRKLLLPSSRVDTRPQPVGGSGTVEIRDERGRLADYEEFTNFIGLAQIEYDKQRVRHGYNNQILASGVIPASSAVVDPDIGLSCFTTHMFATTSADVEAPATERWVPGNIVATAMRGTLLTTGGSGPAAAVKGTIVTGECAMDRSKAKWVWDWPLASGNGTFQSLCWGAGVTDSDPDGLWEPLASTADLSPPFQSWYQSWRPGSLIDPTNGDMYALVATTSASESIASSNVYKGVGWVAGATTPAALIATLGAAHISGLSPVAHDLAVAGNDLWYSSGATPWGLHRIAKAGPATILQTIAKPWAGARPGWIASDGTNLYVCEGVMAAGIGPRTIYKIRASDGVTLTSWSHGTATSYLSGLSWDDATSTLWVTDHTGSQMPSAITTGDAGRRRMTGYSDAGVVKFAPHILVLPGANGYVVQVAADSVSWYQGTPYYNGQIYQTYHGMTKLMDKALGARSLLTAPKTKANNQTMRITYQFNFS